MANETSDAEVSSSSTDSKSSKNGGREDLSDEDLEKLRKFRSIFGSLRYAFGVTDSVLLKLYGVFFLAAGAYLTIIWILALIVWISKLQDAVTVSNLIAIPALNLTFIVIIAVILLPIYVPMRIYRNSLKGEMGLPERDWVSRIGSKFKFW